MSETPAEPLSFVQTKRVGLALGGGLARGLAHIGVLSVLEEYKIPIDFIAGTSAGSLIAAAYCAGWSAEKIYQRALRFRWRHIARPTWPWRGLFSFDNLARRMRQEYGDLQFEKTRIPFTVVAVDIMTGEPVRLNRGAVAPAVQASCAMPGAIEPVQIDDRWLCDGGLADMVPVGVLREMGADYVIGVDIFEFKMRKYLGPLGYLLAAIEILLERAGGGIEQADCLIAPDLRGKTYVRFSKRAELYELGRQATLEKIDCIRSSISQ